MIVWLQPCRGFSCFSDVVFPSLSKKLPFLAAFSAKEGRPPRGEQPAAQICQLLPPLLGLHRSFGWIFFLPSPIINYSGLLPPPLPLLPHCPDADFQPRGQIFCHELAVAAFVLIRDVFSREACFWVWERERKEKAVSLRTGMLTGDFIAP